MYAIYAYVCIMQMTYNCAQFRFVYYGEVTLHLSVERSYEPLSVSN